jgi:hypothetical protein
MGKSVGATIDAFGQAYHIVLVGDFIEVVLIPVEDCRVDGIFCGYQIRIIKIRSSPIHLAKAR